MAVFFKGGLKLQYIYVRPFYLAVQFISCGITHSSFFLLPGIPVYIPCTGTIPTKTVVSVVVGVRVLQKFILMLLEFLY